VLTEVSLPLHTHSHTEPGPVPGCFPPQLIDSGETSQHCCSQIDVTLMPFSAVICLLALILMHVEVSLKSRTTDTHTHTQSEEDKDGKNRARKMEGEKK